MKRAEQEAAAAKDDATSYTLGLGEGRGGRLLHSKSNPNLSQPASFDVLNIEKSPLATKSSSPRDVDDEQKTKNESPKIETSDLSSEEKEGRKKQKPSSSSSSRKERPVTPSYKSFVEDISGDAGKPPRPKSGSSATESAESSSSSPSSVLRSIDIVIEAS